MIRDSLKNIYMVPQIDLNMILVILGPLHDLQDSLESTTYRVGAVSLNTKPYVVEIVVYIPGFEAFLGLGNSV